jgi:hypothetical protein
MRRCCFHPELSQTFGAHFNIGYIAFQQTLDELVHAM